MPTLEWLVPLIVGTVSLVGLVGQLFVKMHRLANRIERTLPTLERIARAYPGRKLQRELADLERAIDAQSQELRRLSRLIDNGHRPRAA